MKSVIDHGKTAKDVQVISDQLVAKRKNENYGRIKSSTLGRFLMEQTTGDKESIYGLIHSSAEDKENSDVQSVADSVVTCTTDMLGVTADTKFILLDLRPIEAYQKYHVKEAINFPAPYISRDKEMGQLLRFKN